MRAWRMNIVVERVRHVRLRAHVGASPCKGYPNMSNGLVKTSMCNCAVSAHPRALALTRCSCFAPKYCWLTASVHLHSLLLPACPCSAALLNRWKARSASALTPPSPARCR